MLCLKNAGGDHGGIRTGGDSADIIMPVRIDHNNYVNNVVPQRPIPCARCMYSKTCYLEVGIDGCQAGGCECLATVFFDPAISVSNGIPQTSEPHTGSRWPR